MRDAQECPDSGVLPIRQSGKGGIPNAIIPLAAYFSILSWIGTDLAIQWADSPKESP
jgi:hypothetical protein